MIKKLPTNNYSTPIEEKINEIIDTIYDMQLAISNLDPDSEWYDGNHIADTSKKVDPYAEQRKWIGKLCRCWDSDINDDIWGILQDIKDNKTEKYYLYGIGYEHCEPVKQDDKIIYKEEQ